MTKVLMSCDDSIFLNNGQYYAKNRDKMLFYQRYLRVFDSLRLVCRCEEEKDLKDIRIPLASDPRIEVVPVPVFHGPKDYLKVYSDIGHIMHDALDGCDAAVLRIPSTVALRVGNKVVKCGLPFVCEVVYDAEDGWRGAKGFNRILWKRIDKQMRRLCAKADGVSCVTEKYLQQHYFSVKPNAFTSHYSSLSLPSAFYSGNRSFPSHWPFVIAHTANQVNFSGRKGHVEVIKAIRLLREKGVDVKVKFAGLDYCGGIDKLVRFSKELGIADYVEFVGYLNREELSRFLDTADIFVLPTRAEGLPRVIIEAMAKGLPCITTPVSGNPELINGHFLVPYDDFGLLADRIEELVTNPPLYEKTSLVNFEKSKQYGADVLQSRRDKFYSQLKERIVGGDS